jgi:hypothetical protein
MTRIPVFSGYVFPEKSDDVVPNGDPKIQRRRRCLATRNITHWHAEMVSPLKPTIRVFTISIPDVFTFPCLVQPLISASLP